MRGRATPVEQPRRGEDQCAAADGAEAHHFAGHGLQPLVQCCVGRGLAMTHTAGDQQRVGTAHAAIAALGNESQTR